MSGSLIAFAYLQPSLITISTLPRHFANPGQGLPYDPIRFLGYADVLNAQSDIFVLLYRICKYKPAGVNKEDDIKTRSELHDALQFWFRALAPQ